MPAKTKQKEKQNKKQKQKTDKTKRGAPLLGLAKSIYYWLVAHVIYQTRERVFHQDIQTPRSGLKKRGAAEFF